jgi:glycerate kinase
MTGEGFLDGQSFEGKAVGGVVDLAREADVPVLIIAGQIFHEELPDDVLDGIQAVSLVERFGEDRARADVLGCVEEIVREVLSQFE